MMKRKKTMSTVFVFTLVVILGLIDSSASLSLAELHGNSRRLDEDKTLRSALDNIRGRRRQFYNEYSEDDDEPLSLPSVPMKSNWDDAYRELPLKRFSMKRQQEEVMDLPLEIQGEPLVYDYDDETSLPTLLKQPIGKNRLLSRTLANKLSELMDRNRKEKEPNFSVMRKRVLVKRNYSGKKSNSKENKESLISEKKRRLHSVQLRKMSENTKEPGRKPEKGMGGKAHAKAPPNAKFDTVHDGVTNKSTKSLNYSKLVESSEMDNTASDSRETKKVRVQASDKFSKNVMKRKAVQSTSAEVDKKVSRRNKPIRKRDDQVMQELKVILGDEKGAPKKLIRKRSAVKVDPAELSEVYSDEDKVASDKSKDFDQWLRDEYWRNFAQSFSTMKRKRDADYTDYFDTDGEIESELGANEAKRVEDDTEDMGETPENENWVDDREERLMEFRTTMYMGEDNETKPIGVNDNIEEDYNFPAVGIEPESSNNPMEQTKDSKENEGTRKVKRSVESTAGESETNTSEDELEKFGDVDLKLEKIQKDLINEALQLIKETRAESEVRATREKVGHRLDAAYDLEDMRKALKDLHTTMQKIDKEPEGETVEETSITLVPIGDDLQVLSKRSEKKCPAMSLLASDCSAIRDLVSTEQLQRVFIDTCNWHEVCYSCGQAYGLLSSDCDAEFLEQNRLACNDSASCESASQLILAALRQRRIFYKRKVPTVCYQQKCVRDFLTGFDSKGL